MSKTESQDKLLPFDIAIVGLGIVGVHQITREVEEIIRRCRHTFVVDSGFGVESYLRSICAEVTSLLPLYEKGKSRLPTYRRMAAEVVNAAISKPPVCFASYGHPLVYCYPATLIQRAAKLLDLRVEIFPGISALDTLLVVSISQPTGSKYMKRPFCFCAAGRSKMMFPVSFGRPMPLEIRLTRRIAEPLSNSNGYRIIYSNSIGPSIRSL